MKRHADALTIDHVIELRRELETMRTQRDNALARSVMLQKKVWEALDIAYKIYWDAETAKTNSRATKLIEVLKEKNDA